MEKKALTWTELRVGLVVIASLVILAITILYIGSTGGSPLAATYHVKALMSDVNGLKAGAPVRLGGVEKGTVTRVDFAPVGGKLESPSGPLGRLVNDEAMSRQLASSVRGIDSIVTRIDEGKGNLGVLSKDEELSQNLKSLTRSMNDIAGQLQRGEGSAGKLLND